MRSFVVAPALMVALVSMFGSPSPTLAADLNDHVCGGRCGDSNGNRNGWNHDAERGASPRGLSVSGDNGRVDKGLGNGGENQTGNHETPNQNGENGHGDDDPHDHNPG